MTNHNWAVLVDRYIVHGETPNLQSPWDVEEAETFLRRPYRDSGKPPELRRELIKALNLAIENENLPVLRRGLRLAKLIPHADFARTLQNIFFTAHGRSQNEMSGEDYKEISLLAIKAMYALQPELPKADEQFWKGMWISLLNDQEYGIPAYNGLRRLDISLALEQLPLLLRRTDLSAQDLGVILRGTRRDLLREKKNANKDPNEALIETISRLTDADLLKHQPLLREAFDDETIDAVVRKAQEDAEEELKRNVNLPVDSPGDESLESLRKQLFSPLVSWLKERVPVFSASIWLVDREKERVHFMWQAGLHDPEPEPPPVIKFGDYVSGTVAKSKKHLLRDLDIPEGPQVYKHDELLALDLHGVFSIFEQVNGNKEPKLELIVNFFDASLEKLQKLQDSCIRNAGVVARTAQHALAKYTDYWVANLTTKLTEAPVLTGAAQTFVEAVSKALPCEEERVALYLYHSDLRRHFLYAVYNSDNKKLSFKFRPGEESPSCQLDERRSEYFSKQPSALRIFDITNTEELTIGITPDRSHLELEDLREDEGINYLGVPLREPAPAESGRFVGRMVGLVEKYRIIKKSSGRVFTPIGEYVLTELVKPAAQPLINALDQELRLYGPLISQVKEQTGSRERSIGDVNGVFRKSEHEFRAEAGDLLDSWYVADDADRVFLAFRTLYDKCTAYWVKPGPEKFDRPEFEARRAFQRAILSHEALVLASEPGVAVTPDLLVRFGVANAEHIEILSSLRIVLVPLINRGRPNGLIGLEFNSTDRVLKTVEEIERQRERATRFVRTSMMRTWLDYRRHLVSLFATFLEVFSKKAEEERWVEKWQDFFNFVACGRADLPPIEKSFGELTALSLKRLSSDAKCLFSEECDNWSMFAKDGHLDAPNTGIVQLLAMPSAVRMVLATSTAPMLWGGTANVSLIEVGGRAGWSQLKIDVPSNGNGHADTKTQALALARWISEYRGWISDSEDNADGSRDDEDGLTIMVPHVSNK